MKRVLSLVLALVLVLGMIPTFAADMTAGQHLFEHEFIAGDGLGNLNEDQLLTREQLAKLVLELNGSKEEAEALTLPPSYTDSAKISAWARPYVAYAQIEGLMKGYTDNTFRPQVGVNGQQLAQVLTRALGYEFSWETVIADAADLGIEVASAATLTRGQAFEAMWTTVNTNPKDGDKPLGVLLGKIEDTTPVVPTTLEVTSVEATNLKEIVVKFNQAVDKATVLAANFSLSPAAGTLTPVLGEDGMTVTITTASAMTNQGAYKLTAEKVATASELKLAKVVKDFTAFDATLPTVESIEVTGPKTFDVIFSEPITADGTVTVKSANTTLAVQSAASDGSNVVSVTLYTALVDGTSYDVTVKDYADAAGYKNVIKTIAYKYVKDTTAPTVSVVSANQQYVVLKFNKPVTGISKANFYHTFSAWTPIEIYKTKAAMEAGTGAITTSTTDVTTVYVQFATTGAAGQFPLQPGTVNVNVLGKVGSVEVKDNWGNAFATTVVPVTIVADLEAPTVTKVEATSNTNIAVTFSKAVNPGTVANYEVLKSDGTAISGLTFTVSAASTTKVNLALSKSLLGETVIVNVKNIEDTTLNKNKLAATSTTTITFADKEFAGINRVEFDSVAKAIYVVYNEAVSDTALNIANYKLNDDGTVKSLAGPAAFFSSNKVVKIELSTTEVALITGADKLLVANAVQDLAGNGSVAFQTEVAIDTIGTVKASVVANGIKAIDKNTVTIQFDQELVSVLPTDFQLTINASGAADYTNATAVAITNNSTGSLVTLTFGSDIPANVPTADVKVKSTFTSGTVNVFNQQPNAIAATSPADKISPKLVTKQLTGVNQITLTYDENLNTSSVSLYTYTVAGNTVSVIAPATNQVVITLGTAVAADATPSVTQALDIQDVAGNKLAASTTAFTVADKVAPTAVAYHVTNAPTSFKVVSATSITVVFTEKLDATKFVAANANGFTVAGGASALTSASLNADGITVTLTGTGFAAGTTTVAYTAGTLTDLAANALASFLATATN